MHCGLQCNGSAGAAAGTARLPPPAPGGPAGLTPPRTSVHRPGCRAVPRRCARALPPPWGGTFRAWPCVPGEGAARGTPAPPSWRPEARRGRRREPQGGRPGGEVTPGEGAAARPPLRAPTLFPLRSAAASGRRRVCGSPSPEKRAWTGAAMRSERAPRRDRG